MSLPKFNGFTESNFSLLQTNWSTQLDPVIAFPPNKGLLVKDVSLINGVNTINHRLGRKPQGYVIADINAAATIYRSQPFDALTLTLTSNAAAIATIWVF
jgi:hypothetical protein